jgi:octaprenyl-diphosphate synthase
MEDIRSLVDADMSAVDRLIHEQLLSDVALINQLGNYLVNSGGKRLRPTLVLLSASACGYQGQHHINLATIVEFIHTATLLHDDVVDESDLRRGRDTANALWGNAASVLVGDFLYSRSFQMMVSVENMRVMRIMADTTNTIAEGEVMQLLNVRDPDTSEARYIEVIQCKTAKLFEAAARLGAVLAEQPEQWEQGLARYGMHLGTAFQLIDDVLDYSADAGEIGKNIGDDLAEGKPTLPLIHAMREGSNAQRTLIREAIEQGGLDRIDDVRAAIESTGAIQYTSRLAREEARKAVAAIAQLPESPFKSALVGLAEFSANRNH